MARLSFKNWFELQTKPFARHSRINVPLIRQSCARSAHHVCRLFFFIGHHTHSEICQFFSLVWKAMFSLETPRVYISLESTTWCFKVIVCAGFFCFWYRFGETLLILAFWTIENNLQTPNVSCSLQSVSVMSPNAPRNEQFDRINFVIMSSRNSRRRNRRIVSLVFLFFYIDLLKH